MAITVQVWPQYPFASQRERHVVGFRPGITVAGLVPSRLVGLDGLIANIDGEHAEFDAPVPDGSQVDMAVVPDGGQLAVFLFTTLVSIGLGIILAPRPKKRGENESAQYGFDGIRNTRVEGQPSQVVYGEVRTGGQILNEWTEVEPETGTGSYHVIVSYGEGPILSIGNQTTETAINSPRNENNLRGIYINDNPIENLRNITAWVRLGTIQQQPVPGFELVRTQTDVDATLDQAETTSSDNSELVYPLNLYNDPGNEAIWTGFAQTIDLSSTDGYDSVTLNIRFPTGLYSVSSAGSIDTASFQLVSRYRELSGGTPITTGGDNGDGWVYVPPPGELVRNKQDQFQWSTGWQFQDPSNYTPPSIGSACSFDGSDDYLETVGFVPPWGTTTPVDELSVSMWVKLDSLPSVGNYTTLFDYSDGLLAVESVAYAFGASAVPVFRNGSIRIIPGSLIFGPGFSLQTDTWYHIAFTYKRDIGNGDGRVRVYLGKEKVSNESSETSDLIEIAASAGEIRIADDTDTVSHHPGDIDQVAIFHKELTAHQIATLHGNGYGTSNPPTTNLLASYTFDDDPTATTSFSDGSGNGNDLTLFNMVADPRVTGLVLTDPGSEPKRSDWRIEVMRLNRKSTSARVQDESEWSSVVAELDEQFAYPEVPYLALILDGSNEQLGPGAPDLTADVRGRLVPVWNKASTDNPTFEHKFSRNPAWCAVDALINGVYGGGGAIKAADLDIASFQEFHDECEEPVPDNMGGALQPVTDWDDLTYSDSAFSGRGSVTITLDSTGEVPEHWTAGEFVRFSGVPTPSGYPSTIATDINADGADSVQGLEIQSIDREAEPQTVTCFWDQDGDLFVSPTTTLTAAISPDPVTGTIEGAERRWTFDGVFDTFQPFWESVGKIAAVGHGALVREGSRIRVHIDNARAVSGKVTMGSTLVDGDVSTFRYGYKSIKENDTRIEVDFLDRRNGYEPSTAAFTDPDIESSADPDAIRLNAIDGFGIVSRGQALRMAYREIQRQKLQVRHGDYQTGAGSINATLGDVVTIANELIPSATSGRLLSVTDASNFALDRDVTIVSGKTYYIELHFDASDTIETKQVTSSVGTYTRGTDITVASDFSFTPAKYNEYIFYEDGTLVTGEITSRSMSQGLVNEIHWREYDASIYATDTLPDSDTMPATVESDSDPQLGDRAIPLPPARVHVSDRFVELPNTSQGKRVLHVSWSLESTTADYVSTVAVHLRPQGGAWSLVGTTEAASPSLSIDLPGASAGDIYQVAVQPRSRAGCCHPVETCYHERVIISSVPGAPDAPTGLTAALDGDRAVYSWDALSRRDLRVEIRRTTEAYGWLLSPVVAVSDPGATSVSTTNWCSGSAAADGQSNPYLIARTLSPSGEYSAGYAVVTTFDPSQPGMLTVSETNSFITDQAWEDYGDGWKTDSVPPAGDPTLTDLTRHADGYLEFTGSSLTGTYTTFASITPLTDVKKTRMWVEAFVGAVQIHPQTLTTMSWSLGDPDYERWTVEGPLTTHGDETGNCTLKIQYRTSETPGAGWTEWRDYRPTTHVAIIAQFRLVVTRPNSDYQVRIHRFHTRLRYIPPQRYERTPVQRALERSVYTIA